MPIGIFPRPSLLTTAVVATSIASGLALGALTAGVVLTACWMRRA